MMRRSRKGVQSNRRAGGAATQQPRWICYFGSNRSKIMKVIDSNIWSGMRAENRYTLFLIPL
jgi:hypothetical protein